ncbi:MAG: metal-sulfur cluster assembly factor [Pseudomonadota bacterium]|nr:metal-sulfur cluster assembly factor [Pseudomonadota bacterium]
MTTAEPQPAPDGMASLEEKVVARIRTVHDPEIPVNLYDLGLIYAVDLTPAENGKADLHIVMTLTTPNCPVAGQMPIMVQQAVEVLPEQNTPVKVDLVFNPPWDKSRMTDEARLQLNMF